MKNLIEDLIRISKRDFKFHWWNSSHEIIMYYILSQPVKEFHQQRMYSEEEVKLLCSKAQMKYAFALVSEQPYSVDEFDKNFNYWFNQNKKKQQCLLKKN